MCNVSFGFVRTKGRIRIIRRYYQIHITVYSLSVDFVAADVEGEIGSMYVLCILANARNVFGLKDSKGIGKIRIF